MHRLLNARPHRGTGALALLMALVLVLASAGPTGASPEQVALQASAACPAPMPVAEVQAGMRGTGLTVSQGTTPDRFSVKILGVLKDGIAPGVDMIIVETDSRAIRRADGIWAGMSGSPVYARDGRLIGAVAYGFTLGPSKLAGLTAAEDMFEVLDYSSEQAAAASMPTLPERVFLTPDLKAAVAAQTNATAEQLNEGLSQLRVPLSVSGLDRSRIERFKQELSGLQGSFISYPGAAAPVESPAQDPAAIVPGGNFAGALSYGDLTVAGVGTATVVCDGRALAFGHPLTFRGEAGLSAHSADAITIVTDPTLGSFKLANIGGVVGTLDQDRLTAIRAQLGEMPSSIPVNSTVNATDTGRTREGTTQVNEDEDLPFLAAFHLVSNLDRVLDRFGEGTAEVTWTATGETASGQSWTVTRANRFASQFDISFESIFELLSMLSAIQQNEFERVHFTGVTIDAVAGGEYRAYRLGQVQVQQPDGEYAPVDRTQPITVDPGGLLNLRVQLLPYQGRGTERSVDFSLEVPEDQAGMSGTLNIVGGQSAGGEPGNCEEPGACPNPATNFSEFLESLQEVPRNDEVIARLTFFSGETGSPAPADQRREQVDQVVSGAISISVQVNPDAALSEGSTVYIPLFK